MSLRHLQTPTRHPPDTRQTSPESMRCQQTTTDTNRQPLTPQDTDRCCLSKSGGVCWRLLLSVGISRSPERYRGCLGDVWWVSGGIRVVFMEIGGTRMCLGGYLGSQSLQYGATTLFWHSPEKHDLFSPDYTETSTYQNVYI